MSHEEEGEEEGCGGGVVVDIGRVWEEVRRGVE